MFILSCVLLTLAIIATVLFFVSVLLMSSSSTAETTAMLFKKNIEHHYDMLDKNWNKSGKMFMISGVSVIVLWVGFYISNHYC